MDKAKFYSNIVSKFYPQLQIDTCELNQDGQYNDVLMVNDELVFRFAKVKPAIKTLRNEIAVLNCIRNSITLPLPDPIYSHAETDLIGEVFMGYRLIPGIPLWRPNFRKITDSTVRNRMAQQLAGFLYELHGFAPDSLPVELENTDSPQSWADMYQRIKKHLFPHMRSDAKVEVAEHFESFLNDIDRYRYTPCLRHGDFGTGNILYDPDSESIAGIVDFGSIGIGDPATDFAGLYISFGDDFYQSAIEGYPEMENALDRVHFYCGTFALQEALFGIENGDEGAFQNGISRYL